MTDYNAKNLNQLRKQNKIVISSLIPYFGKPNLNNRIYTEDTIDQIINEFSNRKYPTYGELGYPDGNFDVSLSNVSHRVDKIWKENGQLIGRIEVLDTEKGRILESLLNSMIFRPRSIGSVNEDMTVNIERTITFDAVDKTTDGFGNDLLYFCC